MKLRLIRILYMREPNPGLHVSGAQTGRVGAWLKNGTIPDEGGVKMNKTSFVYGVVLAIAVFCLGAISASGSTFCVGPSATGDGSGTDWNNLKAWSATPARGDIWYLANGNYTARTFSTAASGTTVITIMKATVSDHGPATGWSDSYAAQAVITGTMVFSTPYWIFSGSTRNEANWFDGSAYGIQIAAPAGTYVQSVFWRASYSTMSYIYINASVLIDSLPTVAHYQVDWTGGSLVTAGNVSHCYVHNGNNHFFMRNCSACVVEYCASDYALSTPNNHGENINWYGAFGPSDNCVARYNMFYNNFLGTGGGGTAVIAIVTSANCEIYGNVFYNNRCGDGVVGWSGTRAGYGVSNLKFYNNTIIGHAASSSEGVDLETSSTGCVAYNNVWYGNTAAFQTVTHDYNATQNALGETHGQTLTSSSIFVNYTANDYRLASATAAGMSLPSPYNQDMLGNIRGADGTWDRGAFEFGGVPDTTPPVITSVGSSSVTSISAVIAWTTDGAADSVVDYGTTTAYGFSVTNSSMLLAHSITLASLNPNTVYHYRVHSTDAAGNTATSGDFTLTTAIADTTPPTVTLTAPANGATVSNTVSLTATASDNVGVAGVKFFVNGTQVKDSTSSPYSYLWDSTQVANGPCKISAQARDAAGNVTWSGTNTVTVNNSAGALPSPVAYWSFDEGTGTTAADSVSGNTLTLRNGATWSASGIRGAALSLDGVSGRADAPNSAVLNITGSVISVEAWVNLQDQGTWQQLVAKVSAVGALTSPYYSWHLYGASVSSTQWRPQFQLVNSGGTSVNVSSSIAVNYGEWVHVVGVYDGSTESLYVNGSLQGSAAQSGAILGFSQPLYIGASGLPDEFTKGLIDEVRVYSEALSATQIQALYNNDLPPAPTGLHVAGF